MLTISKALILAALLLVFAPAAQAAPCGGLNQPVCKKFPNPMTAQCGQWLRNVNGYCRPCGGRDQQACAVLAKGPVCKPGLARRSGTCVAARADEKAHLLTNARQQARRLKPLIDSMAGLARGLDRSKRARIKAAIRSGDADGVRREMIGYTQGKAARQLMLHFGLNTLTVGIESSASFGAGVARETGVAMDLNERVGAKLYVTTSKFGGVIANIGNDLVISAYTARNDALAGPSWGAIGNFDLGSGLGMTIWYAPRSVRVIGVSVGVGIGNVGAGGAVADADTRLCVRGNCN